MDRLRDLEFEKAASFVSDQGFEKRWSSVVKIRCETMSIKDNQNPYFPKTA
jgi:hypothetical protein